MSTEARPRQSERGLTPYRLNVRQFESMIEAGIVPAQARVELIDGRLVRRMTKNDPHDFCVETLAEAIRSRLDDHHFAREEKSLRINDRNQVEPDIQVVRGQRADYQRRRIEPADVALVIEVADTTYSKDSGRMLRLYASAGIPVYWIVRIPERRVEVYTSPTRNAYAESSTFDESAEVPLILDGAERGRLPVPAFLPWNES